jgi:hypothetical protein
MKGGGYDSEAGVTGNECGFSGGMLLNNSRKRLVVMRELRRLSLHCYLNIGVTFPQYLTLALGFVDGMW